MKPNSAAPSSYLRSPLRSLSLPLFSDHSLQFSLFSAKPFSFLSAKPPIASLTSAETHPSSLSLSCSLRLLLSLPLSPSRPTHHSSSSSHSLDVSLFSHYCSLSRAKLTRPMVVAEEARMKSLANTSAVPFPLAEQATLLLPL